MSEERRGGMKAKTVSSIIRRKIDSWLASIDDEKLREQVSKNVIVTGGAIASMLLGEPVSDFDVYFRDHDTTLAAAQYYLAKFKPRVQKGIAVPLSIVDDGGRVTVVAKSAGIAGEQGTEKPYSYFEMGPDEHSENYVGEVIGPGNVEDAHQEIEAAALAAETPAGKKKEYRPVFMTSNAITLSDKVQLILRFYGEPDAIHENYDFVHCTNYWTSWDGKLTLRPAALEALLCRDLRYVGSKYPICSIVRLRKFIARGWKINAGQILKMAFQVSTLDLGNIAVLEDQLTGVDTAYFVQLIDRLKEKDPTRVDAAYLVEITDRIF